MKKILTLIALTIFGLKSIAQPSEPKIATFYVNVFINESKEIRVENDLVAYENVSEEVKRKVYNHSFKMNENIVYRIYGDHNLMLGYIMDVEQEMFKGYSQNVRRERYLLETVEMEIDGPNWLKKIEGLNLERSKD